MDKLSYKSLFIIVGFLLISIVLLSKINKPKHQVLADWYNDNWTYRQAINISTHNVGETNVYITATINIGTTTKAQADDGDFRFTDAQGNLLPYFISANTGTTAPEFHIQISNFPSGALTIFAYYGNPSVSNGFLGTDFSTHASNYSIGSYSSEEIGGAPVAWWKFDEGVGTSAFDSSGQNSHGTILGAIWTNESQCITGKCLKFDGSSNYIQNIKTIDLTQKDFTMQVWIFRNEYATTDKQIFDHGVGGSNKKLHFIIRSNKPHFGLYSNDLPGNTLLTQNKWYLLTFVHDDLGNGTAAAKIYVNGTLDNSSTLTSYQGGNTTIKIGGGSSWNYINGFLDDAKIYTYARSAAQIKKDYVTGISGQSNSEGSNSSFGSASAKSLSDGLVGYWKFDEGVGTTTADSSGNSNLATFATGSSAPSWSSGKYGVGLSFSGSQFTDIGQTIPVTGSISMAAWVKGSGLVIGKYFSHGLVIGNNSIKWVIWGNDWVTTPTISVSSWNHVVAIYDQTINKRFVYVNGIKTGEIATTGNLTLNAYKHTIGEWYTGYTSEAFNGNIDEVRIYNRALNSDEIKQLYNFAPGPIGYWKFEEGSGSTAFDSSGNGKNGLLTNTTWNTGKFGKSILFNGTSSNISIGSTILNLNGVSFWVKPTSTSQYLLDFDNGTHYISTTSGVISAVGFTSPLIYINGIGTSSGLTANTWNHISVYSNTSFNGSNIAFGMSTTNYFSGLLDDIKIYNYARTNEQIIQDMQGDNSSSKLAGPIAYYKFDEGGGSIANNSGIGGTAINGTWSGTGTHWTLGKINKSAIFDLTKSDYINVSSLPMSTFANGFTWSSWIKTTNYSGGWAWPYSASSQAGSYIWFQCGKISGNGNIRFETGDFTSNTVLNTTNDNIADGNWHQLSCIWDKNNGYKYIYIDGIQKASATATVNNTSGNYGNLFIGAHPGPFEYWDGSIDEVKIYNYALSSDEIKQDYNQGATFVMGSSNQTIGNTTTSLDYCVPGDTSYCANPIAEYKFEEGVGTTVYDTSGNGNKSLWSGTGSHWINGKIGGAGNFNGSNDNVTLTNHIPIGTGDITISAWIKPIIVFPGSSYVDYYIYSDSGSTGDIIRFMLRISSTGSVSLGGYLRDAQTVTIDASSLVSFSSGFQTNPNWKYVTFVKSGTNLLICLNGTCSTSGNVSLGSIDLDNGSKVIGPSPYKGSIDQVRIYNYARTLAQVAYDYNKGAPIGWWKFDECQGSVANDSSGIGNSGSISIGSGGTQNSVGTCATASTAWGVGSTGKTNSSLNFDGTDDYISVPAIASIIPVNHSRCAWIKSGLSSANYGSILDTGNAADTVGAYLMLGTGYIRAGGNNGSGWNGLNSTNLVNDNTWHHACIVFTSGTTAAIYVDGTLNITGTVTYSTTTSNNTIIGRNHAGNIQYFQGLIDDVRLYNYPLTSTQIKTIYNGAAVNFR